MGGRVVSPLLPPPTPLHTKGRAQDHVAGEVQTGRGAWPGVPALVFGTCLSGLFPKIRMILHLLDRADVKSK